LVLLLACKPNEATPFASPLNSPVAEPQLSPVVSEPEPSKATVVGRVLARRDGKPIANVPVRLAEVFRKDDRGAFALDDAFSPGDLTDSQGWFSIENIEPREYVIIVGEAIGAYEIIQDKGGQARVWDAVPDQVLDVGELEVDLGP